MKIILEFYDIEEINEFFENWNSTVYSPSIDVDEVEDIDTVINDEPVTYRNHAESTKRMIPILTDVDEHGNLQMRTQKTNLYTIFDLLELKRKIPQVEKFPTWESLAKAVGLGIHTVIRLSAGIELGYYDHIFIKWENMPLKYDEFGQVIS